MKFIRLIAFSILMIAICPATFAQSKEQAVQKAIDTFVSAPSLKHASVGVSVMRLNDKKVMGEYCSNQSQITASTMKTVTSSTALSLLGKDFKFHTTVTTDGTINDGRVNGNIIITGSGDPTLGSEHMRDSINFVEQVVFALKARGVKEINGKILVDDSAYPAPYVSGDWMVEDLGYGYGTSVHALNFCDNTLLLNYEIDNEEISFNTVEGQTYLKLMNHGTVINEDDDSTQITGPEFRLDINDDMLHLFGTMKPQKRTRTIANPSPDLLLRDSVTTALHDAGIKILHKDFKPCHKTKPTLLLDFESPALTDIVNSLLVRSDNMYTESVLRAIAIDSCKAGTTLNGVEVAKNFWMNQGVDIDGLFMVDGSGLARTNKAPVSFFNHMLAQSLENLKLQGVEFNKLFPVAGKNGTVRKLTAKTSAEGKFALKSGSMNHVQCYVGYYPAEAPEYTVSILINSFTGARADLVKLVSTMLVGFDNALDN